MSFTLVLDPPAAISGRVELDLNEAGLQTTSAGVDFGEASIKAYLAEQQYGEGAVSFRVPNRVITIPLMLGAGVTDSLAGDIAEEEEVRRKLNEKIALLQRQGGVLLRQRPGHEPLYADIVTASLTVPDVYGETGGVEPNTVLKCECLPDFYGEEITLDPLEEDGQIVAVLQESGSQAAIKGDYPARTRIVLTEAAKADQRGALWGLRSTFFDATPTSALFFDAKDMTPINGATVVPKEGTFSGEAIELAASEAGVWHPLMTTDLSAGPDELTHVGSYRVAARVWAPVVGEQVRLVWSADDATAPTTNAAQAVRGGEEFSIVDLGEIRLQRPPIGEHWWRGVLQVNSPGGAVVVDRLWLQPVDDGAGKLRATGTPTSTLLSPDSIGKYIEGEGAGHAWTVHTEAWAEVGFLESLEASQELVIHSPFALPEGVTIRGIKVEVAIQAAFNGTPVDVTLGATTQSHPTTGLTSHLVYGGSTDLWGKAWTAADINEATFGPRLKVTNPKAENDPGGALLLKEGVRVTVYYSYSAGGLPEDAILYSERHSEIRFDGCYREDTTTEAYVRVSEETGDLPRLPPSGLEGRPVEVFLKNSRGLLDGDTDAAIDALQAQVIYRPCYIGRI
jgi:hypothetical protein